MRNKLFTTVRATRPPRNTFDLSHERKLTMNMGELIPIYVQPDITPGDKFRVSTEALVRMAPMIAPVMHRINLFTHYFFVPYRLVWDNWADFITGGEDGNADPVFPKITIENDKMPWIKEGTLSDHLGIPSPPDNAQGTLTFGALIHRAYHLIYNEYYRDENLSPKIEIATTDTVATAEVTLLTQMRYRAWEKDYFTSALPWAQKGGEVGIPVDFNYKEVADIVPENDGQTQTEGDTLATMNNGQLTVQTSGVDYMAGIQNLEEEGVSVTINELRKATRLQEWLEKNARGGSRYAESILSLFGVKSSDARLQRPEYLGGGKTPLVISEVLQTSASNAQTNAVDASVQGNMAGHGIGVGKSNSFSKSFEEHGVVLGIASALPRSAYQDGLPKEFTKYDKFDYYFPQFANLGEQPIQNGELQYRFGDVDNEQTFGYTPRYAEMKFKNSSVHGDFKKTLSYWHLGRIFDPAEPRPGLNDQFVRATDVDSRIFAVDDADLENTDKLYVQLYNNVRALRPMPIYGTPTL